MPSVRRVCCCRCGCVASKHARVAITGYTIGCCVNNTQSEKPNAALYGTWDLTLQISSIFIPDCLWATSADFWPWTQSGNTVCGGSIGTSNNPVSLTLFLAPPARTGTGGWEWQLVQAGGSSNSSPQFRGNIPWTPGDCVTSTLNFTNNGINSAGNGLIMACGTGGSATVDFI